MKFNIIVFLFFVLIFTDCSKQKNTSSFPIKTQKELDKTNKEFISIINKNKNDIKNLYIENAILINDNGDCIRGNNQIADFYKNDFIELSNIKLIKTHMRVAAEKNIYEIGFYYTKENNIYAYLASWCKIGEKWYRELDILSKKTLDSNINSNEMDIKRKMFGDIINNEHNVKKLVENLYDNNDYYYSKGNLLQGQEILINTYSYMANPDFNITLKPDITTQIKPDRAYEIGSWHSSGQSGKYIFIWKKQDNGDWKVLLDSNY